MYLLPPKPRPESDPTLPFSGKNPARNKACSFHLTCLFSGEHFIEACVFSAKWFETCDFRITMSRVSPDADILFDVRPKETST